MTETTTQTDLPTLDGTPVGMGMSVVCDSCNRSIARGKQRHDHPDDRSEGFVYLTRATGRWSLRWVSCEECGPISEAADANEGEVVAKCAFALASTPRDQQMVVANAYVPEEVDQRGDLTALRR